ncbi:hypothetical protein [Thomasclavelia ramosa]|uniref:hypothetical protein n=1 Tax=Thomasclavelia ramosa TaxID=1547 RepID=UPI00344C9E0D
MDEIEFYLKDLESRFKCLNRKKYYLSYSGGKDSHFLYWFIKEYLHDNEIEIVGVNTYMEHQEILARIVNDDYYFENDPYGEDPQGKRSKNDNNG